jgi:DNA (cytosine-5)-methyltransferase 1
MKVLDLFSGIGGFSLGLEAAGMETVAFCEFDEHARKVLKKHWPDVPIHNDVRELDGNEYRGTVDVVCGGFPCQDLSNAGKKAGITGDRSSLYREMLRIISECLPRYAIFENVSALLTGDSGRWFAQFLYDLAEVGYDAEWHCIPACFLGASHQRDRVWVVAYPNKINRESSEFRQVLGQPDLSRELSRGFERIERRPNTSESLLYRENDGVSTRSYRDRLARLGNSVVPQIPEAIGRAIMAIEQ